MLNASTTKPEADEYDPASHRRHSEAAQVKPNVPGKQSMQMPELVAPDTLENLPESQGKHALMDHAAASVE